MISKNLKRLFLAYIFLTNGAFAYDVEKEGKRWYVYNGSELIGTYSYFDAIEKYSIGCGDPKVGFYETKYANIKGTYTEYYSTQRDARDAVIVNCRKR